MLEALLTALNGSPRELITLIVAALPLAELRGSIPLALAMKMSPVNAFVWSIIGNSLIIAPTLFLLEPVSNALRRFVLWRKFFDWLFERTKKKADVIQKYEALGLMIFVAIPLPMTGAWSGCVAASLFKIKFRYAFAAIFLGVVLAGAIVMAVCLFGIGALKIFLAYR